VAQTPASAENQTTIQAPDVVQDPVSDALAIDPSLVDGSAQAPPVPEEEKILGDSAVVGLSIKVWSVKLNDPASNLCLEYPLIFDDLDSADSPGGSAGCKDFSQELIATAVKGKLKAPLEIIQSLEKIGHATTIISTTTQAKNLGTIPIQAIRRDDALVNVPGMDAASDSKMGFDLSVTPTIRGGDHLTLEYRLNAPKVKSRPFPQHTDLKIGQTLIIAALEEAADNSKAIIIAISSEPATDQNPAQP
jgi:hypothetical protein